ncbi:MAG: hypothetical protein ACTSUQ_07960 [Candidatus Freyarchaeota archaeon]
MGFWNGVNVERVYRRLRVLAFVFALPAAASMLYLLGLDSSKIFLLFQTAERFPTSLHFAVVSPLEVEIPTLSPQALPTGNPITLILTPVFAASLAGTLILTWYASIVHLARYTPGYNTFGDVKSGVRSILRGPWRDRNKRMLTLLSAMLIAFYVAIVTFFLYFIAKIILNLTIALIAVPCMIFVALVYYPVRMFLQRGLQPPHKQDNR